MSTKDIRVICSDAIRRVTRHAHIFSFTFPGSPSLNSTRSLLFLFQLVAGGVPVGFPCANSGLPSLSSHRNQRHDIFPVFVGRPWCAKALDILREGIVNYCLLIVCSFFLVLGRVFNKNLSRWQNFRSRRRMKYSRRRCKILVGSGGILPRKISKIWAS